MAMGHGTVSAEECPFCGRVERGEYDQWDAHNVAFIPLRPVTPGHFLVVSRAHVDSALASAEATGLAFAFAVRMARLVRLEHVNFITSAGEHATQTVRHLHVHVVPRSEGDGLPLPWTGQER
jgi:histidine triad (HIT) family protein